MKENIIARKSFLFSVRIMNLYKYLSKRKGEYIVSKQICKTERALAQMLQRHSGRKVRQIL